MEPIREGLFEIKEDTSGYLLINRCERCGRSYYPRRIKCIECFGDDMLVNDTFNKRGTLYTYTVVYQASPSFETPYMIGYIDFEEEGMRIFAQIAQCKPADLKIGMQMEPFFEEMKMRDEDKRKIVCKFRPVKAENQ